MRGVNEILSNYLCFACPTGSLEIVDYRVSEFMNTDYYFKLVEEAAQTISERERIPKHYDENLRRSAAVRLSDLMRTIRPFSFLRLGDMELGLMLANQAGEDLRWTQLQENQTLSSSVAFGHPGLDNRYVTRLQRSYEQATYVDFHERWWINRTLIPLLKLNRPVDALRNRDESDSHLFFEWLRYSFKDYIQGRRCLFVGAEAGVLGRLFQRQEYKQLAKDYWPETVIPFFQAEESLLVESLDQIKSRIVQTIKSENIDTLFLSLGGGAKIICAELAGELDICSFDFGGLMRGLTYSGSDGHNFVRSTHHPFFLRVPFDLFMDAFEESHPGLALDKLLVKAQCQVMLDLADHEIGESQPTMHMKKSERNLDYFHQSLKAYQIRYAGIEKTNQVTRKLAREFLYSYTESIYGRQSVQLLLVRVRNRLERFFEVVP